MTGRRPRGEDRAAARHDRAEPGPERPSHPAADDRRNARADDRRRAGRVPLPQPADGLSRRRRIAGLAIAAALLSAATIVLTALRSDVDFAGDVSVYLLVVVLTSLVGGLFPALLTALAGSVLLNFYFATPLHTLRVAARHNLLALLIFLLVAALVSRVVDQSARRSARAVRARAEAEALSELALRQLADTQLTGIPLSGGPPDVARSPGSGALDGLLEDARQTFGASAASLLERAGPGRGDWRVLAAAGTDPPVAPQDADAVGEADERLLLALRGRRLSEADQRLLATFAAHLAIAYREHRLAATAREVAPLAESERVRTALLNAVSHDLRTPIASAKAAVTGLRSTEVAWSPEDRAELLSTADQALDRLTDLITNLLDLSRLQAGVLPMHTAAVGLADVLARALDHVAESTTPLRLDVPDTLPEVQADAGLLERALANLVQNALRYNPPGPPVRVAASVDHDAVVLRVIDHGPGIPPAEVSGVFESFRRRDDHSASGVGLGLAIVRGFTEAMGGQVHAERTPGGGATLVLRLPIARQPESGQRESGQRESGQPE